MRKNSKNKGNRAERALANAWENWSGLDFGRVPASGGIRWKRTADTVGDIICTDKIAFLTFPFSIESKFHKEISLNHLLLDRKSKIDEFWEQAKADAARGSKIPILFFRYNGMPKDTWFVAFELGLMHRLKTMGLYREDYLKVSTKFYIIYSPNLFKIPYKSFIKAASWR